VTLPNATTRPHRSTLVVTARVAVLLPRVGLHLAGLTAGGLVRRLGGHPA
jgi:hypothetical protein